MGRRRRFSADDKARIVEETLAAVHLQRLMGMAYMEVQDQLALFYWMRQGAGLFVVLSALLYVYAVFGPARENQPAYLEAPVGPAPQAAE